MKEIIRSGSSQGRPTPRRQTRKLIINPVRSHFRCSFMKGLLLLTSMLFLWTCEWAPEQVDVEREVYFRTINLALGDTVDIVIAGYNVNVKDISNISVAAVEIVGDSAIQLITTGLGKTLITINHLSFLPEGFHDQAASTTYLDVSVSDGIPLDLYLEEWTEINFSKYLTELQLEQIDSLNLNLPDEINVRVVRSGTGAPTGISLLGKSPGVSRVEITLYDSLNALIAPLHFEATVTIRSIILAEIFTNAGCINCPSVNHNLDLLYEAYAGHFAAIRYHVFWTDPNEPMNLYNPAEVEDRRVFYGSSWEAPRLIIHGEVAAVDYENMESMVSQSIEQGTVIYIPQASYAESMDSMFINLSLRNFGPVLNDLICWSVLTEDSIYYAGTNGETIHMQVMRDMQFTKISELNETISISHGLKRVPNGGISEGMHVVTFLQDLSAKAVLQVSDYSIAELKASMEGISQ